jgi:hypothetical protein
MLHFLAGFSLAFLIWLMRTEWLKACETSRKRAKHTSPFLIPYIEAVDEDIA